MFANAAAQGIIPSGPWRGSGGLSAIAEIRTAFCAERGTSLKPLDWFQRRRKSFDFGWKRMYASRHGPEQVSTGGHLAEEQAGVGR